MFHHLAWALGSYSIVPPAKGNSPYPSQLNPTVSADGPPCNNLEQLFQEKEEADLKAREEAERKQQELEEKLKREEEERSARKRRIEEIMARTRKGKDNGGAGGATTPTSSTPKKVRVRCYCSVSRSLYKFTVYRAGLKIGP